MEIKYVDSKPIISHNGVHFDKQEDKLVYLNVLVQLLKAISSNTPQDYNFHTDSKKLQSDELLQELRKYCPNLTIKDSQHHNLKYTYDKIIEALAKLLRKKDIQCLIVPMYQIFAHILHSIQNFLSKGKSAIDSKLEVYQDKGRLLVKLQVLES